MVDEEGRGFEPRRRKLSFFCGVEIEWKNSMEFAVLRNKRSFESTYFKRNCHLPFYILNINVCFGMNKGFRWPENEDSRYGGPTLKKNYFDFSFDLNHHKLIGYSLKFLVYKMCLRILRCSRDKAENCQIQVNWWPSTV